MKLLSGLLATQACAQYVDENNETLNEAEYGNLDEFQINELLGLGLFEGDIITDEEGTLQQDRNAQMDLSYRWPDRLISIGVEPQVSMNVVGSLHQAIREMEAKSLVSFRAADETIEDWIRIYLGGGCSSSVGRIGGRQSLSLANGCDAMATIMHEFTHALGIKHAQSRPDRDDYVEIMWDNIDPTKYNNFEKASADQWTTFGSPYPYMSVMHYSSSGFAIDKSKPTIVTKDPFYQNLIGQRASYTKADNDLLNNLYSYSDADTDLASCGCEKIEFSGLTYQSARNGVYVKDANGALVGDRFGYAHETNGNWLYYRRSSYSWWIGGTKGGSSRGVQAPDVAYCPENVEKNWQEYSGEWQETGNVVSRCVDTVKCCSSINLMHRHSRYPEINGEYLAAGELHYRTYYVHSSEDYALFFNGESWEISSVSGLNTKLHEGFVLHTSDFCISDLSSAKFVSTFDDTVLDSRMSCGTRSASIHPKLEASIAAHIPHVHDEPSLDTAAIEMDTSGYCPADQAMFSWKIDDWQSFFDAGNSRRSPVFVDKEGYSWQISVYPNSKSSSSNYGYLGIYAYLVAGDYDSTLAFPAHGKQITMGILEQGKPCSDRVTQRRMITTVPSHNAWENPSQNGASNRGYSKFLSHDLLFYRDWNYIYDNSIIFTVGISEATGKWLECDMAEVEDYSRCLMKQEYDDDLNIESDGSITGRGTARVTSIPHSQYGERCLSVTITTATSITFAITGEILSGSEFKAGTVFPWYRERVYPSGETEYNFLVDIGFEDYYSQVQQYVTMEVVNHEDATAKFIRSEMTFGRCPEARTIKGDGVVGINSSNEISRVTELLMIIESYADPGNDSMIILWSSLITACVIGVIIAIIYLGCAVRKQRTELKEKRISKKELVPEDF